MSDWVLRTVDTDACVVNPYSESMGMAQQVGFFELPSTESSGGWPFSPLPGR